MVDDPLRRRPAAPLRVCLAELGDAMSRMAAGQRVGLGVLTEFGAGVGARRVEQTVAGHGFLDRRGHEGLGDEVGDAVDDLGLGEIVVGQHEGGRIHRERAGEHAEPAQDDPFGSGEQHIAPVERGPESLVARHGGPAAAQQPEPVGQQRGQPGHAERVDPAGREFDREGEPVELAAGVGHHRRLRILEPKAFEARGRAFYEKLHGRIPEGFGGREVGARRRGLQRSQPMHALAGGP